MKKLLFSMVILLPGLNVFSQINNPCARAFNVSNNGNGTQNCPAFLPSDPAYKKDGIIIVNFQNALPPEVSAPDVLTVQKMLNQNLQNAEDMKFMLKNIAPDRQSAEYCFYSKINSNLFNGNGTKYVFTIQYEGKAVQACGPISEGPEAITLPVKLISFTAVVKGMNILLDWKTSFEEHSKGFYVQKKTKGTDWTAVAFVPSKSTNGTGNYEISYRYEDASQSNDMIQYRLKQVDLDGKENYSEIRSVWPGEPGSMIHAFPNPSRDGSITVTYPEYDAYFNLNVVDAAGRVVHQVKDVKGNYKIRGLKTGQYIIVATGHKGNAAAPVKLIVQ